MRGNLDFSSWSALASTLFGLVLITLIAVGIRLIFMQTIQRRRERENRQINERLRTLIAAYKTLGGSFTGELSVDPSHFRQLRQMEESADIAENADESARAENIAGPTAIGFERRRRIRDAVEAALSDVILLGTEEQVRLAAHAANEMVAGHKVDLAKLVVSLRDFIRKALDLEPIPPAVIVPNQGPLRPSGSGRSGGGAGGGAGRAGGNGGGAGAGMDAGMGVGMGAGMRVNLSQDQSGAVETQSGETNR
ncbi:MAG: hypothetical protein IPK63_22410 [Candidatus Competibacteraceae bacterium]|nr:hypothetical protein [Candidatus Competibacteraceae bacterium]